MKIEYNNNQFILDAALSQLLGTGDILSILPKAEQKSLLKLATYGGMDTLYFPTVDVFLRMVATQTSSGVVIEIYCVDVTDLSKEINTLKRHIELTEEKIATLEKVVADNSDKIKTMDKWISFAKNSIGFILVAIKIAPFVITGIYALLRYLGI